MLYQYLSILYNPLTTMSSITAAPLPLYILLFLFTEANRNDLVSQGSIPVLINTLQSSDHDIQYYCSAIAIIYHYSFFSTEANRNDLVSQGPIPVLINTLQSSDHDIQYYCSAIAIIYHYSFFLQKPIEMTWLVRELYQYLSTLYNPLTMMSSITAAPLPLYITTLSFHRSQ